jgi:hypothetical protein
VSRDLSPCGDEAGCIVNSLIEEKNRAPPFLRSVQASFDFCSFQDRAKVA